MGRVSGKVAIVTGGASGVGKDDAILLVKEGAKVVLTDLNEKDGNAVARQIGDNALFVTHDISSEDGWKEVIARTEETFGGVDILVNNAAILIAGTIEDTTLENWQKIQRVNSDGYFLGCKYGYAAMKKRGGGSIVNMSSMAGIGGVSSFCAYSASKGAVAALTRSIAAYSRFHQIPIRCNSIHPDGIQTPMVFNLPRDPKKPPKLTVPRAAAPGPGLSSRNRALHGLWLACTNRWRQFIFFEKYELAPISHLSHRSV